MPIYGLDVSKSYRCLTHKPRDASAHPIWPTLLVQKEPGTPSRESLNLLRAYTLEGNGRDGSVGLRHWRVAERDGEGGG
jgi:hypothetical protein